MKIVKKDSRFRAIVRAPRYLSELQVQAKTFGSPILYKMNTMDASLSGVLLSTNNPQSIPFKVNTILEITLFAEGITEKPINFVGKIVRRDDIVIDQGGKSSFGVKIIDIDHNNSKCWDVLIEYLQEHSKEIELRQEDEFLPRPFVANGRR